MTRSAMVGESDQAVSGDGEIKPHSKRPPPTNILPQLNLPLAQSVACAICGAPFEVVRRRGRPERFCGDECRGVEHRRQKAKWSREHASGKKSTADQEDAGR